MAWHTWPPKNRVLCARARGTKTTRNHIALPRVRARRAHRVFVYNVCICDDMHDGWMIRDMRAHPSHNYRAASLWCCERACGEGVFVVWLMRIDRCGVLIAGWPPLRKRACIAITLLRKLSLLVHKKYHTKNALCGFHGQRLVFVRIYFSRFHIPLSPHPKYTRSPYESTSNTYARSHVPPQDATRALNGELCASS